MSSVNFRHTEACFAGATCRGGESGNNVMNTVDGERLRHWIVIGKKANALAATTLVQPPSLSGTVPWPCHGR
jgi:hypothetical protein